jgi:hypothetical protein
MTGGAMLVGFTISLWEILVILGIVCACIYILNHLR